MDSATLGDRNTSIQVVDIQGGHAQRNPGVASLRIPLHAIKTKAFLHGKSLAILSDGKRYAALEKECEAIKASGVDNVMALVPRTPDRSADIDHQVSNLPGMLPQEFIAERAFGVWKIVNLTSIEDLQSPLFQNVDNESAEAGHAAGEGNAVGLQRTLVVVDDSTRPGEDVLSGLQNRKGQTFLLNGGLAGLRRYEAEATAMARALSLPRISERGCAG